MNEEKGFTWEWSDELKEYKKTTKFVGRLFLLGLYALISYWVAKTVVMIYLLLNIFTDIFDKKLLPIDTLSYSIFFLVLFSVYRKDLVGMFSKKYFRYSRDSEMKHEHEISKIGRKTFAKQKGKINCQLK